MGRWFSSATFASSRINEFAFIIIKSGGCSIGSFYDESML